MRRAVRFVLRVGCKSLPETRKCPIRPRPSEENERPKTVPFRYPCVLGCHPNGTSSGASPRPAPGLPGLHQSLDSRAHHRNPGDQEQHPLPTTTQATVPATARKVQPRPMAPSCEGTTATSRLPSRQQEVPPEGQRSVPPTPPRPGIRKSPRTCRCALACQGPPGNATRRSGLFRRLLAASSRPGFPSPPSCLGAFVVPWPHRGPGHRTAAPVWEGAGTRRGAAPFPGRTAPSAEFHVGAISR